MRYRITNKQGGIVSSNLAKECISCFNSCVSDGSLFKNCLIETNKNRRQGIFKNDKKKVFICGTKVKTTKLFRENIISFYTVIDDIEKMKSELKDSVISEERKRNKRLIHNLTSINAHNIQEIYALVPQEILRDNLKDQIQVIKKHLETHKKDAAFTFLRIAKHNLAMKAEFSVFNKLYDELPKLDTKIHQIRKVILNVLHTFFIDFSDKNIYVKVDDFAGRVKIDYESIHVALFHLIDNMSKYSCPNEDINIQFQKNNGFINVDFKMYSIQITDEEQTKIFEEGYSGKYAKIMNKHGQGIGMTRIKKLLELNGAELIINRNETSDIKRIKNINYAKNVFTLKFN